ncbi:MAG: succinic semialdehyde dehydrogenase [Rubrobacter sp.]
MPFTGRILAHIPRNSADDVHAAARRARASQRAWRESTLRERARIMLRFHDLILDRQNEVLDLIQLESGKARRHALDEVLDTALVARYYAKTARSYLKTRPRKSAFPIVSKTWENRHPKGLCGFITPWNYPLNLAVTDAIPATLAGNAALIKPDEKTPFTALWAFRLLKEAGLPPDLVQVVVGDGEEIGSALTDESDFVMFTGSTETGRKVASRAAQCLTGFSLELGGKNAMVVCEDADLDRAILGAEAAAFSSGGQLCVSAERIYVHASVYDGFASRLTGRISRMDLNPKLDYTADMGSLASEEQLERLTGYVEEAVSKGARVLAGGRARPEIGPYFYEPTLLDGVTKGMRLFLEETFGPVAALYRFRDEDEAVRLVNESDLGLNHSVWTTDERQGRKIASRLEAGTVGVNDAFASAWAATDAPMGGFKESGIGRRHGAEGILKYTESQTISAQRISVPGTLPGGDAGRYAKTITAALRLAKHLPRGRLR